MCGIAGICLLDGRSVDIGVLRPMTDAIAHRGPDGEGRYVDGPIGLGHRRLAILDLSDGGRQPMASPDGRYVISYNGEIYNHAELRIELQQSGCVFRSSSDTETLLQALAVWGPQAIERLNGMFAFACWDTRERRLLLARDRYGIKPLYLARSGATFAFASEIKAILAHPDFTARLDPEGLIEYLTFQNFFTERTLFAGILTLPAGCYLEIDVASGRQHRTRYWDFRFEEPSKAVDEREALGELDRLFCQAVERQLMGDVEIGAYLSGGMDSGAITSIAASRTENLKSFTCGFDLSSASGLELAFDERRQSELMSYRFGTEHYEFVLKAGDMQRALPALTRHLEEPRVGQSYPNFYAAKLAGRFVKVVLSGTGGDELFGGYPWRYYRAVVNDGFEDYVDKYYRFWQRLVDNSILHRLTSPIREATQGVWTRDIFRDVFPDGSDQRISSPAEYVNHSLYLEAKTFLHGLLTVEDKLSMAHSLESRVPFLDNDLVDFAMRLPVDMKLANLSEVVRIDENEPGKHNKHFMRTRDGKRLLRKMLEPHVPAEVSSAVKQGFSGPDASWFKGESIDFVRKSLMTGDARIYEYLDRTTAQDLVEEHLQGKANRRLFIWSMLNLEQWCHEFLR